MKAWGRRGLVSVYVAAAIGVVGAAAWATTALWQEEVEPTSLLPEETFLVVMHDGGAAHADAYKQTAEYAAFYESGLADLFTRVIDTAVAQDDSGNAEKAREAINDLLNEGFVLGSYVSDSNPPLPGVVLVLKNNAKWYRSAAGLFEQGLRSQRIELEKITVAGRSVSRFDIPNSPGMEVGLWQDGGHLVLAAGQGAVKTAIDSATGERPRLNTNERFQEFAHSEADFTQNSLMWLDWQQLQNTYGEITFPVPNGKQLSVAQVLEFIGLDKMEFAAERSGFKGEAMWTETLVSGLGSSSETLTMDDLPPLPQNFTSFWSMRVDVAAFYDKLKGMSEEVASFAGENERAQLDAVLQSLPQMLGFDPKADVIDHFGNVLCVYDDALGGMFGMGATVCLSLDDSDAVAGFISSQMDRLEKAEEAGNYPDWPVYPVRVIKDDEELIIFDIRDESGESIQMGAMRVVDDWLVISVLPQAIEAFSLRLNGDLPRWEVNGEYATALDEMPQEFSSVTVMNTRNSYQLLMNIAVTALPFVQQMALQSDLMDEIDELPFYVEDFPHPERVTGPLFPNVAMSVPTENGFRVLTRASTYGVPMQGSSSGMAAAGTAGVLTALLLPAVQQARTAARRSQSKNNLKQLGLAMHNHHDVWNEFPRGTVPNDDLKPEERLAWTYSILPFVEQAALYETMDKEAGWDKGVNDRASTIAVPTFQNPAIKEGFEDYAPIHYAGMAGVGKDAPKLGVGDKGAGMFGYNRKVRVRDVTDGLSNTIMITEINDEYGPWSQGGKSTIRALTKKPYINGPDGIGSPDNPEMVQVLRADGSVLVISKHIDPKVMEALSTIRGGETIGEF